MKSLKLTLSCLSALASPMQSDTIFGAFCWSFAYRYGSDLLSNHLINKKPFFVCSDAFPEGLLPMPILQPAPSTATDDIVEYANRKKFKKQALIPLAHLSNVSPVTVNSLFHKYQANSCKILKIEAQTIMKNTIDRKTGTAAIEGGLYSVVETFYEENSRMIIYIKYDDTVISLEEIIQIWADLAQNGIGKDKNTGKGKFAIESFSETPPELAYNDQNAFISLSHGLPDADCHLNFGKTITKFSKHGGDLAISGQPYKNPIMLYRPGSTFRVNTFKEYYGQYISGVSNKKGHVHNAVLFPLFIKVEGP